jgi:hypothetical protein
MRQSTDVIITSLNIEGFKNNKYYFDQISPLSDIICLQEIWLFECELTDFTTIAGSPYHMARAVDWDNPISPWRLPRGYGGIAILWSERLDKCIKPRRDIGNQQVQAVEYNAPGMDYIILNCYMPSGNSKKVKDEYQNTLQILESILLNFINSHTIILAGDFNVDLFNRIKRYDGRRKELSKLLSAHNLLVHSDGQNPTMIAHDGRSQSCIDYIVTNIHSQAANQMLVHDHVHWNTSCHQAVSFTLLAGFGNTVPKTRPRDTTKYHRPPKIYWSTLDPTAYQHKIQNQLDGIQLNLLSTDTMVHIVQDVLAEAALQVADSKISKPTRKRRKNTYPKPVLDAVRKARSIHRMWKDAGRPPPPHPIAILRRKSRKAVRAAQRRATAEGRTRKLKSIMSASADDQRTFHHLVNLHKAQHERLNPVLVDGTLIDDPEEIMDAWSTYFSELCTPNHQPTTAREETALNIKLLDEIWSLHKALATTGNTCPEVTHEEIERAIRTLNPGRAADETGLATEHLTKAGKAALHPLSTLVTRILRTAEVPKVLKTGRKIPFPKKGKDHSIMGNYRGITITPTLGKLVEHVILHRIKDFLPENYLQFGFTPGLSPSMAALFVTEAMIGASANSPVIIVTLDVQKAFDTVDHNLLKQKLAERDIPINLWACISELYSSPEEHVVINGMVSKKYSISQGVRQGGVTSTHLYKLYIDELLQQLQSHGEGLHFGPIYAGTPTCADDMLLLSSDELSMQNMLDTVQAYSSQHLYKINPEKTTLTVIGGKGDVNLFLGTERLQPTARFTHLGISRSSKGDCKLVEERIALARRTVYALIPAGLYGQDGLSPAVSRKIIMAYVTPRMIYGLEAVILSKKDYEALEVAYRRILREVQGLPPNTAREAIHLLIGLLPITAELHLRALSLFGAISRLDHKASLKQLAVRQISTKSARGNSWFRHLLQIARGYDLEHLMHHSLATYIPKDQWKRIITSAVRDHWYFSILKGATQKSSLRFWDLHTHVPYQAHPVWPQNGPPRCILAASFRAKMLAGVYVLQATRARYNQFNVNPRCLMCTADREDMQHFIAECPALAAVRQKALTSGIYPLAEDADVKIPTNPHDLCRLILNGGTGSKPSETEITSPRCRSSRSSSTVVAARTKLHKACSTLCLQLHLKRHELLAKLL